MIRKFVLRSVIELFVKCCITSDRTLCPCFVILKQDLQSSLIPTSAISEYYLGGEGDLFKAPEPIIEEPLLGLDPMAAAISMMSCGEDAIPAQSLSMSDIESSIESGQLLSEVFYECRKDLMAKDGNEAPYSEVLNITIPIVKTDENLIADGLLQKSASSSCLRLMDSMPETQLKPNFLDFPVLDFGYGMRRAFSEGDIKVTSPVLYF